MQREGTVFQAHRQKILQEKCFGKFVGLPKRKQSPLGMRTEMDAELKRQQALAGKNIGKVGPKSKVQKGEKK